MYFRKEFLQPSSLVFFSTYFDRLYLKYMKIHSIDLKVSFILGILSKNLIRQQLDFWGYKTITKSRKKYDFYCCLLSPWRYIFHQVHQNCQKCQTWYFKMKVGDKNCLTTSKDLFASFSRQRSNFSASV